MPIRPTLRRHTARRQRTLRPPIRPTRSREAATLHLRCTQGLLPGQVLLSRRSRLLRARLPVPRLLLRRRSPHPRQPQPLSRPRNPPLRPPSPRRRRPRRRQVKRRQSRGPEATPGPIATRGRASRGGPGTETESGSSSGPTAAGEVQCMRPAPACSRTPPPTLPIGTTAAEP